MLDYFPDSVLEAGSRWQLVDAWLGVPATIITSVLAAGAAVTAMLHTTPLLTAGLAGSAAVLNGLHGFLQPDVKGHAHGLKGNKYHAVRDDARTFLKFDLLPGRPEDELSSSFKELRRRYNEVKQTDPPLIPRGSYKAAKRNIEAGEAGYTNDPLWQELDE